MTTFRTTWYLEGIPDPRHRSNGLLAGPIWLGAGGATYLSLHNFKFLRNCSTTPAYAGEGGSSSQGSGELVNEPFSVVERLC
jgi:hypothetical protein